MREQYWDWYVNFKYKIEYLIAYKIRKDRLSDIYSAVLLLASAAGIASLSFWDSVPILWGAITLAAQVMQTIKPKIPSFRQGPALNYILQDLERYLGQFTRNYTQTVKRAADNKRRYAPGWVHSTCLLRGFPKGAAPHLAHDFAEQSVVCYTLCRRCPENTVAAGEGKGI